MSDDQDITVKASNISFENEKQKPKYDKGPLYNMGVVINTPFFLYVSYINILL